MPAVDVNPDQLEVLAVVRAPDAARIAVAAHLQRPDRDPLPRRPAPGGSQGPTDNDRGADLVAEHPRELRAPRLLGQLAREEVVVRAADPDRFGMDHDFARAGVRGLRPVEDRHRANALRHGCAHRCAHPQTSPAVSTISSSFATSCS